MLCVSVDLCDPNPCQNNGNCTGGCGEFTCDCANGFMGKVCDSKILY